MKRLYPLQFEPVYQDYIWGGERIGKRFNRRVGRCAESWEIADQSVGMSRVVEGPLKGKTLHELVTEYKESLLGENRKHSTFPLLIKILDAKEVLSVQVHPDDEKAAEFGGEAKSECWFVVEGGTVYVGFKEPITQEEFKTALKIGAVEKVLQQIEVKPSDLIFIPGGRIHAIGAGCMMIEIQQNSNTTYRVFDWNRKGFDNKPRPLHLEQAFRCMKWDDNNDPRIKPRRVSQERIVLAETLFFCVERLELSEDTEVVANPKTFQIFFDFEKGRTILLPACSDSLFLERGTYLKIFLPNL